MAGNSTKAITATKNKNKVVLLKEKMAEALNQTKRELADILSAAVSYCEGLDANEIHEIVSDKSLRPSLKALGLQVIDNTPPTIFIKPNAKRAGKRSKVTDQDIIKFLASERSVGDVRKHLGQLVPKRLAGLAKAGKLSMREDGLKKLWKAK